ncbi:RNA polymerase sigma factor [Hominifimenecus sp. rT4P-3]|uniref:RNA polymerase sigma factor n=1 Tax=Hominifimenecus sp. rT4P-3 TaxID=3242979 RepID=UPI003DA3E99F
MEDDQIVKLYWMREENAIQETNAKYGAYCFSIANHILSNVQDSEECVNDTWMRAWNSMPPKRPDRLRLFLARITRNLSFDCYKAKTAKKRGEGEIAAALEELGDCISSPFDVEGETLARELAECVNRFLHTLPPRECDVFLQRYFYVESVAEIGEFYDLKPGNVLTILSRTRKKLKEYLEKEGYGW